MRDLEITYATAAAALASSPNYDAALEAETPHLARTIFERGALPAPPARLTTNRVVIALGAHTYSALTVDQLHFSAHRETFRALGLFILSALLTPGSNRFELELTHTASDVRRLIVDSEYRRLDDEAGLRTEASGAVYFPSVRSRVAGTKWRDESDLLRLVLTDMEEIVGRDWPSNPVRDTVVGFGSDRGAYAFAELLLDVSQGWNAELEYVLEGPYGFGGVALDSAEVRLWLPGSSGWNPSDWIENPAGNGG